MSSSLKELCIFTSRYEHRHRQPMPGYEQSHNIYIGQQSGLVFFTSNKQTKNLSEGWEFYISIKNPQQLACAWSEIHSVLLDVEPEALGIAVVNIGSLTEDMMEWTYRGGTSIVIYPFVREFSKTPILDPRAMCDILCRIETKLRTADILAGDVNSAATLLRGSKYISLRNSHHPDRGFIGSQAALQLDKESSANPFGRYDPYSAMEITSALTLFPSF